MDSDNTIKLVTNLDVWISIGSAVLVFLYLGIKKLDEDITFNIGTLIGIVILLVGLFVSLGMRL